MQRDIETLDVPPLHSHSYAARRTAYARTHLVCPVRICGGHMLRPPGGTLPYVVYIRLHIFRADRCVGGVPGPERSSSRLAEVETGHGLDGVDSVGVRWRSTASLARPLEDLAIPWPGRCGDR